MRPQRPHAGRGRGARPDRGRRSPDNSDAVGRRLAAEDRRVEFRRHATNLGPSATYNEAIDFADSDYVLLLSADDALTPGALARSVMLMDAHPDVVMTYGRVLHLHGTVRPPCPVPQTYETRVVSGPAFCEESSAKVANLVFTPSAVVRTSEQRAIGGYRVDLPHTGDMEMWFRCEARGSIGFIDADQAFYRVHGQNMSTAQYVGAIDLKQQWVVFDELFRTQGHRLANREHLEAHVRRHLAWRILAGRRLLRARRSCGLRRVPRARRGALAADSAFGRVVPLYLQIRGGSAAWSRLRPAVDALRGRRQVRNTPAALGVGR